MSYDRIPRSQPCARRGLAVLHCSVLSRFAVEETQLTAIGRFLAMPSNGEVNALATVQYQRVFSRKEVYQLAPALDMKRSCGNSAVAFCSPQK
jgi:hypothetical protein